MTFGQFLIALMMCFGIMYPLNIFSNILNLIIGAITGSGQENPIVSAISSSNPLGTLVFAVILGPVLEELVFRGLIISRMRRFGDKAAILFSAAIFALFHETSFRYSTPSAWGSCLASYMPARTGSAIRWASTSA